MLEHRTIRAGFETVVVEPSGPSTAKVIMLHGYSMSPAALSPFAHSLRIDATFYFPRAPFAAADGGWTWWHVDVEKRRRALANGPRDLADTCPQRSDVRSQLLEFVEHIDRSQAGDTFLCGFSQGGMLAMDLLLMEQIRIRGLALFCSCMIDQERWLERAGSLKGLSTFISHGSDDPDLAFEAGCRLRQFIEHAGAEINWVPFEGGHEIPLLVWRKFKQFIRLHQRTSG